MPAKKKGGRGKTINLLEFNEDYIPEDNLDWAVEVPQERTPQQVLEEKLAKRDYSRTANNILVESGGFRETDTNTTTHRRGIEDLQPPFVAHFGNLRNGTTEEEFLRNFHEDVIVTSRLISQEGRSFAFVEFKTAQALIIALAMDQSMVKGRKLYVDLATPKQVERLRGNSGGLSRQGAGQMQSSSALQNLNLTRDTFGTTQTSERELGGRSGFGSRNDLHALENLSRDTLGTAVARASDGIGTPLAPPDFSSWRTGGPVAQPEFQPTLRENRRSENDLERRGGRIGTGRPPEQAFDGLANWRDEPVAQAQGITPSGHWPESGGRGRGGRGPPRQAAVPPAACKWETLRQ
ncbi:hypothetical protein ERJ75_000115400 [Trypanosoma vivax]|nr:hypothetical protein ERJ75_000115400 [Trypanosoma vivax]